MIMKSLFLSLLLPLSTLALTPLDASLVFGKSPNTTVTGSSATTDFGRLTILLNGTHALVSLNATSTSLAQVGWMAVGWGTGMSGADMVVAWPTPNEGWTLSHRSSTGHVSPRALSDTSIAYTPIPSLSTTEQDGTSYSTVSFLRPLNLTSESGYSVTNSKYAVLSPSRSQKIIWAAGSKNPNEKDDGASIEYHDIGMGTLNMDLSPAFPISDDDDSNSAPITSDDATVQPAWTKRDTIIVAHGIFGVLAYLIFAPLGALIGRFARRSSKWVSWHRGVQLGGTAVCTVVAVALGIAGTQTGGGQHWVGSHKQIGLVIVILMMLQIALGEVNHWKFQKWQTKNQQLPVPESRVRPWNNYLHIILGITLLTLGYVQIRLGLSLYTRTPKGLIILFWIVLSFQVASYLLGYLLPLLGLLPRSQSIDNNDTRASNASSLPGNEKTIVQFPGASRTISDMNLPKIPQSRGFGFLPTHNQLQMQQKQGPYVTPYPLSRQPSLAKLQSNSQTPAGAPVGPSPRDFARPPYGFGSAPMSNAPIMTSPLVRKSSRNQGVYAVPVSDSPRYVHRADSVSSHGSGSGGAGGGGGYWTPPEVQKIELAGDWVKKSSGVQRERGHGRKESLKRRSVSSGTGSLSTSGHGHGF